LLCVVSVYGPVCKSLTLETLTRADLDDLSPEARQALEQAYAPKQDDGSRSGNITRLTSDGWLGAGGIRALWVMMMS
jgi:hypothetical protein